jgi:hypothetical protein
MFRRKISHPSSVRKQHEVGIKQAARFALLASCPMLVSSLAYSSILMKETMSL